jgi:cyclic pyranopterin phosphate synthase
LAATRAQPESYAGENESKKLAISSKPEMTLRDQFGRSITDLRISVTDRCNFRCVYCRSADPENHMAQRQLLRWEEFDRLWGFARFA